ncbi:hypothetical protein ABZ543_08230 [Streptomyces roseifaciens]
MTQILNGFVYRGTGNQPQLIRLGNGRFIAVRTGSGSYNRLAEVYLSQGLSVAERGAWAKTGGNKCWRTPRGDFRGRLYREVLTEEVRKLIRKNGGEHRSQSG